MPGTRARFRIADVIRGACTAARQFTALLTIWDLLLSTPVVV
jgi:hypothetical protein